MKTICIYHSRDLDGWMSAAIVKKWFLETLPKEIEGIILDKDNDQEPKTNNFLFMLGWDYGDEIPDLSSYEKVIMADVAFPKEKMLNLSKRLAAKFIWIDHHISAINDSKAIYDGNFGLRDTKFAACELTWKYFFPDEEMPEIVRLLGMYDSFRHKGMDEEQKVLEFQYGARAYMSNYEDCFQKLNKPEHKVVGLLSELGKGIYKYLCTEAQQTYKKAFPIEFIERVNPDLADLGGIVNQKFLCVNQCRFNPINFGIDYHKEGYDGFACFHYENEMWNFSLYNDNGEVDCSVIAKQYGGGGHQGAAGFRVDNLNKIIK